MIDLEALRELLLGCCPAAIPSIQVGVDGETYVDISQDDLLGVVYALMQTTNWHHLSAITGSADEEGLQVLYHVWLGAGLSLRVRCGQEAPRLPSLVPLIPGADWYEREAHDLLGIEFSGHPNLKPLLLPDKWDGPPPLLAKDGA